MWVDLKVVHKIHDKGHTRKRTIRLNLTLKSLLIVVIVQSLLSFLFGCFTLLFIRRQAGDVKEILQDIERSLDSLAWPFPWAVLLPHNHFAELFNCLFSFR